MRMMAAGLTALLTVLGAGVAEAHHQQLVLALPGPLGARFAGYYVADYQGFYDEGEVAVRIVPGDAAAPPMQALTNGEANIVVATLPEALALREQGLPLVNVGQIFKHSGMGLTCRKDAGIAAAADLKGKKLGLWRHGDPYPLRAWLAELGLKPDGSAGGVTLLDQGDGVDLLVQGQADCISTATYDQALQLADAGLGPEELVVFDYATAGVATLADGLYVPASALEDEDYVQTLGAFLHHTMRGWLWAQENPVEAARIVLEYDTARALTEKRQVRIMEAVNLLTAGSTGAPVPEDYRHTLAVLRAARATARLPEPPASAMSESVARAANLTTLF